MNVELASNDWLLYRNWFNSVLTRDSFADIGQFWTAEGRNTKLCSKNSMVISQDLSGMEDTESFCKTCDIFQDKLCLLGQSLRILKRYLNTWQTSSQAFQRYRSQWDCSAKTSAYASNQENFYHFIAICPKTIFIQLEDQMILLPERDPTFRH